MPLMIKSLATAADGPQLQGVASIVGCAASKERSVGRKNAVRLLFGCLASLSLYEPHHGMAWWDRHPVCCSWLLSQV